MKILIATCLMGMFIVTTLHAQERQDRAHNMGNDYDRGATYGNTQQHKSKSKQKLKYDFYDFDGKIKEHEALMRANAKAREQREKEMQKPQYSDPTYFGHKRKPKKRPPGKKKLCKECGIKH